jgi:hypothetical protein
MGAAEVGDNIESHTPNRIDRLWTPLSIHLDSCDTSEEQALRVDARKDERVVAAISERADATGGVRICTAAGR